MLLNSSHILKYYTILVFVILLSCKKKQPTLFNTDYIFPISSDSTTISKLLGFTNINIIEGDNCAILIDTLEIFKLRQQDFLPELDFTISDTLELPSLIFGFPFPPGFEIPYNFENDESFIFEDVELKKIDFNNLKIKYTVESNLNGGIYFDLTIPSAINSFGEAFNEIVNIPNSEGQLKEYTGEIFLSNYIFDLSNNQTTYNNISTTLRVGCSEDNSNNIILSSSSFLSIKLQLIDLNIKKIEGYFGSINYADTNYFQLPAMRKLESENFTVENPQINLLIDNGIGIDAEVSVNSLEFIKIQSSYFLDHQLTSEPFEILRATEINDFIQYSNQSFNINNQNSNLNEIIPVFPESFNISYYIQTNPLGNHLNHSDFFNGNHTLESKLAVNIPFKFNLENLTYSDTIKITAPNKFDANSAKIHLEIENQFPISCCIRLKLPNGDSLYIDSNCISSANLNSSGNLQSASISNLIISINEEELDLIINEESIIMSLTFNSPKNDIKYPISTLQKVKYKMGLELNYDFSLQ